MSLDAFLAAAGGGPPSPQQRAALAATLGEQIDRARAAHDGLAIDPGALATIMGEVVAEAAGPGADHGARIAALAALAGEDIALAIACARGDAAAIDRFRRLYMHEIPAIVRRVGGFHVDADDVAAGVTETLFVAQAPARPRILDLVGRGSLAGLVRVIAVRTTMNLGRRDRRRPTEADDALATVIASQTDPELGAIKQAHRAALEAAIEAAIATLEPDERNLLRLSLLHRLSIDEIAGLQQVHRATAARRLARIREQLGKEARRLLVIRLGEGSAELEELYRLVRSSLDVSFERLLAP